MKLISEFNDNNLSCVITEGKTPGEKSYVIEGVFAQADLKNRNGRIYPKAVMEKAVEKYVNEQVKTGRAVGELNHPDGPTVNLDKVSHLITDLRFEGNNVIGRAKILNTPMGQIVKGLLDGGVQLGVSTRGMGSISEKNGQVYVNEDFILNTVDIVQDPSAHDAFVNGIMEGKEFSFDANGKLQCKDGSCSIVAEETEKPCCYKKQIKEFKDFLNGFKLED